MFRPYSPGVVNYSFGIQRDIGFGTVIDASYVGTSGRHLLYAMNISAIPMYAHFDPANIDATTKKPLPDNFLQPYQALGKGRYFQFRTEFYNAFNHTQFSSVDSSARFDAAGDQVDANLGVFTGARDPRRIQFSLRLMF